MLGTVLIVLLVLFLVGALPTWNHSRSWGYSPSGGLGLLLIIVVCFAVAWPDLVAEIFDHHPTRFKANFGGS